MSTQRCSGCGKAFCWGHSQSVPFSPSLIGDGSVPGRLLTRGYFFSDSRVGSTSPALEA